ncbi:MAG: hypothetical protein ACOCYG_09310, partial [Spirochaetota bacterium]
MAEYITTSFSSGEIAPRFYGRFDLQQVRQGAKRLRNVLITPEGAVTRRTGTQFFSEAYDSSNTVRLLTIQHSSDDATVVEVGYDTSEDKGYMKFIRDGAYVQDADDSADLVVDAPWAAEDLHEIQYTQFGGFYAYLVHPGYNPRRLSYDPDLTVQDERWELWESVAYDASPTGNQFQFDVLNWGEIAMADDYDADTTYDKNVYVIADDGGTDHIYRSVEDGNKGNTPSSSDKWEDRGEVQATKGDYDFAPGDGTDGNKPAACALYASRLVLGGSEKYPAGVFGSAVSLGGIEFTERFAPDTVDLSAEDAWYHTIYGAEYDRIVWLLSEQVLLAGTTNGLWRLGGPENPVMGTTENGAMIPLRQSSVGCEPVPPVMYGGMIVFVERGGRRVRAAEYAEAAQKYTTSDLTSMSFHLTESKIVKVALQRRPWMILWAIRGDGKVASFSFSPETGVSGWSLHEFSGVVEDVTVVPTGINEQVWFAVKREINGSTVRHIEHLEIPVDFDENELNYADSFVRWKGDGPFEISSYTKGSTDTVVMSSDLGDSGLQAGDRIRFFDTGNPELDGNVFEIGSLDDTADSFGLYYFNGTSGF